MKGIFPQTPEDKVLIAKGLWTAAFEETLKECREHNLGSEATFIGMIEVMTSVIKALLRKEEE